MKAVTIIQLGVIGVGLLGVVGWAMNIFAIIDSNLHELTGLLLLRLFGVFVVPLGSILGWFF
jgi:hypothetical protein